jgi:hypothetical protein
LFDFGPRRVRSGKPAVPRAQRVEVWFYGEHGAALIDPNITTFAKILSGVETIEKFTGGQQCRNYLLSKYQGKHAGADGTTEVETYPTSKSSTRFAARSGRGRPN